jgi:tryptophan halogenase
MIKQINSVVVVGGGSAGWMSAAALIRTFPNKNITVIESPDVPIVGVGESTLGAIKKFCHYLDIDEKDFIQYTDATLKMSIKFTDFFEKDSGSFHYPFGNPVLNNVSRSTQDWLIKKAIYENTPVEDFVDCYFPSAALFKTNKFSANLDKKYDNFNPRNDVAYHFDATKFGAWLKNKYCLPKGVTLIPSTVTEVKLDDNGIKELILKNGTTVQADLFIDCTGFKSLLIGQELKVPFDSFEDILINNRAWACQVPYKQKEKEIEPFTHCTAIGHGWVWNTPLWSRLGTGYVYSDKFISPDDAKEEFKKYLMSDKMTVPRTAEEIEKLSFKDVPMRVGMHKQTFVKNVVAIGLSAGFLEPLESNGLYSVHEFLFKLLKTISKGSVTQWDRDVYNDTVFLMFRSFAEFISLHYALSIRDDTEYWRSNSQREYSNYFGINKKLVGGFDSLKQSKMFEYSLPDVTGINWVAAGMNYFVYDDIAEKIIQTEENMDRKNKYSGMFNEFENRKNRWREAAEKEPSLYEYLKNTYYKDKE